MIGDASYYSALILAAMMRLMGLRHTIYMPHYELFTFIDDASNGHWPLFTLVRIYA